MFLNYLKNEFISFNWKEKRKKFQSQRYFGRPENVGLKNAGLTPACWCIISVPLPTSMCRQECPCVERVQDSALIPVNVERKVTLVGKHLNVFQVTQAISSVTQQVFAQPRSLLWAFCEPTRRTTPWTTSACWTSRTSRWWWRRQWSRTRRARPTSSPVSRTRSGSV